MTQCKERLKATEAQRDKYRQSLDGLRMETDNIRSRLENLPYPLRATGRENDSVIPRSLSHQEGEFCSPNNGLHWAVDDLNDTDNEFEVIVAKLQETEHKLESTREGVFFHQAHLHSRILV